MTATQIKTTPGLTVRLIDGVLAIKPLANLAKHQARNMMIKRAEKIGIKDLRGFSPIKVFPRSGMAENLRMNVSQFCETLKISRKKF